MEYQIYPGIEEKDCLMLRRYRRNLHKYPETGWLTYRTTALAAEILEKAGYEVFAGEECVAFDLAEDTPDSRQIKRAADQCRQDLQNGLYQKWKKRMGRLGGAVAVYDSGRPGETIAFRFDIDGLPVGEDGRMQERRPVAENFMSRYPGCSHACGHDGHTAMGLVLARKLMERRSELTGRLIFIFQTAEEGVRGAKSMCRSWKFGRIHKLICCHIGFTGEDQFVAGAGGFLATTKLDVEFTGRSAHAGLCPERGRNALLAAAEAAVKMQDIPVPETGIVRLNVGTFQAGEARNTVPAHACFQMETRGSDSGKNQYLRRHAEEMIRACSEKYGVKCVITEKGESDSADSSRELSRQLLEIARDLGVYKDCLLHQTFGASDDGAVFMNKVQQEGGQAAYILLGTKQTGHHHESAFDFDEQVLDKGLAVLYRAAGAFCISGKKVSDPYVSEKELCKL